MEQLEVAAKREAARQAKLGKQPISQQTAEPVEEIDEVEADVPDQLDQETVDRLKAIIAEFDEQPTGESN